MLLGKKLG